MARQDIFKQIRGNESEHRNCANKFKQTSGNPTDKAYKQKRQGKDSPGTYSCYCSCQGVQRSNKQAANKSEHRKWDNKFKQTYQKHISTKK